MGFELAARMLRLASLYVRAPHDGRNCVRPAQRSACVLRTTQLHLASGLAPVSGLIPDLVAVEALTGPTRLPYAAPLAVSLGAWGSAVVLDVPLGRSALAGYVVDLGGISTMSDGTLGVDLNADTCFTEATLTVESRRTRPIEAWLGSCNLEYLERVSPLEWCK